MSSSEVYGEGQLVRNVVRSEGEPLDELGRLGDHMVDALVALGAQAKGVNVVLMLDRGDRGGLTVHGDRSELDALVAAMGHMEAWGKTLGLKMRWHPLGEKPDGE